MIRSKKQILEAKLRNLIRSMINEDRFVSGMHPTQKAYWTYLEKLPKDQLVRIAKSKSRISGISDSTPKQDLIADIFSAEIGKDRAKEIKIPEAAKQYLTKFSK